MTDTPEMIEREPITHQQREDAFVNMVPAIDAAGMCPGVAFISNTDHTSMTITMTLSNDMIRKNAANALGETA